MTQIVKMVADLFRSEFVKYLTTGLLNLAVCLNHHRPSTPDLIGSAVTVMAFRILHQAYLPRQAVCNKDKNLSTMMALEGGNSTRLK